MITPVKEISCTTLPDGTLVPSAPGQFGNAVISIRTNMDPVNGRQGTVNCGNDLWAWLSYDITQSHVIGYTPVSDNPVILTTLARLYSLF